MIGNKENKQLSIEGILSWYIDYGYYQTNQTMKALTKLNMHDNF